jgi:hypothetical protein
MIDVEQALKDQFETAVSRAQHGPTLEEALKRGRLLRRRRVVSYSIGVLGAIAVVAVAAGVLSSTSRTPSAISPADSTPGRDAPSMQLTEQDRAALVAEDAVFGALHFPRDDGMYPYYGGNEMGPDGTWVSVFHLMKCSGFNDCPVAENLIRVHVTVDGDVGSVQAVTGPVSSAERESILGYESSYPEGSRSFEVAYSWLRDDGNGLGAAIGSVVWRGSVPTYGFEYQCTATVFDADGNVLYEGAEHAVPLGAPDEEVLRSGLVAVPVELSADARSTRVACDEEGPAPIPQHTN